MKITIDDGALRRDLKEMATSLNGAAEEAGRAQMKELIESLRERVIEMIPDLGGWYDLYKQSIKVNKLNDDNYELTTTIAEINYSNIDAETSLIWLTGSEGGAEILAQSNPWTLDTIPALDGDGLKANMLIRPASEREVNHFRSQRLGDLAEIKRRLAQINIKVLQFDPELPKVNGRVTADVPFLAKRLEYGLGGFPRTPIWSRITAEAEIIAKGEKVQSAGQNVYASRWWSGKSGPIGQSG